MLNKASLRKVTQNYVDFRLDNCAKNIDKKIEQLKDEKAIALILKAIQDTLSDLKGHKEESVSYQLCAHNLSFPGYTQRLEIEVTIGGEKYNSLLEEIDGSEVCYNYMNKLSQKKDSDGESELTSSYGKFINKSAEYNFIQLGNAYLGKTVTSQMLESLIDKQYHV